MMKEQVFDACRIEDRAICPTHPGGILKRVYLDGSKLTITEFAARIGVSRKAISAIVNERKSVTPEMALRFAAALKTTPEKWILLQNNYDLWQAAHSKPGLMDSIRKIAAVL